MKIEIECKLPIKSPDRVKELLGVIGADDLGEVYEKNWVFEKDGELKESRSLLRLRMHDEETTGIVTHKAPATEGKFKSRQETETIVENATNMRLIFEGLGYSVDWYYEKRRHTYKYSGTTIMLDHTPELGMYIEIEGNTDKEIEVVLGKLELDINDNIMISYPQIWRERCEKLGVDFCEWKF